MPNYVKTIQQKKVSLENKNGAGGIKPPQLKEVHLNLGPLPYKITQ